MMRKRRPPLPTHVAATSPSSIVITIATGGVSDDWELHGGRRWGCAKLERSAAANVPAAADGHSGGGRRPGELRRLVWCRRPLYTREFLATHEQAREMTKR